MQFQTGASSSKCRECCFVILSLQGSGDSWGGSFGPEESQGQEGQGAGETVKTVCLLKIALIFPQEWTWHKLFIKKERKEKKESLLLCNLDGFYIMCTCTVYTAWCVSIFDCPLNFRPSPSSKLYNRTLSSRWSPPPASHSSQLSWVDPRQEKRWCLFGNFLTWCTVLLISYNISVVHALVLKE